MLVELLYFGCRPYAKIGFVSLLGTIPAGIIAETKDKPHSPPREFINSMAAMDIICGTMNGVIHSAFWLPALVYYGARAINK